MFDIYIYYKNIEVAKTLKKVCSSYFISNNSDDEIFCINSLEKLERLTGSKTSLYLLECTDNIETTSKIIHNKNLMNYIVLIVKDAIELMNVIKPTVRPSGVIMEPIKKDTINNTLNDIAIDLKMFSKNNTKEVFSFKSKTSEYVVPINDIMFFESKCKKIYINTISQEFSYYDTLSTLENTLSEKFIRVHKGYIVNIDNISSIDYNQNYITMNNGIIVPISRTYKPELKTVMKGRDIL